MEEIPVGWAVIVPVKRLALAKTRLRVSPTLRPRLALAMAADTVSAAIAAPSVTAVIVVTDDTVAAQTLAAIGADVVADGPDVGINSALVYGASHARARHGTLGIAALAADLPALHPGDLTTALELATRHRQSFVSDLAGAGTTLYAARGGAAFRPEFGPSSRTAHARSATELDARGRLTTLRQDVDTLDDLVAAASLGLGPRTALLAHDLVVLSDRAAERA